MSCNFVKSSNSRKKDDDQKKDAAYLILCPPNKIFLPSFLFPTKAGPLEYPRFPPQKPANMFSTLQFFLKFVTFVISVQVLLKINQTSR